MCLIVNADAKIWVAKDDIVCYKVLYREGDRISSIYRDFTYELGKDYVLGDDLHIVPHWVDSFIEYVVYEGFHSFVNKTDAEICFNIYSPSKISRIGYMIVRCVIPVGSRYIMGTGSNGEKDYCSDRIRIEDIIKA